ncbi:MAG: hypothetical protein RLZZ466_236 [Bacteroidota bacterium]|jgi:hypothetical protein
MDLFAGILFGARQELKIIFKINYVTWRQLQQYSRQNGGVAEKAPLTWSMVNS